MSLLLLLKYVPFSSHKHIEKPPFSNKINKVQFNNATITRLANKAYKAYKAYTAYKAYKASKPSATNKGVIKPK